MNIPIAFTFDDNYALGGGVAIYSLLENAAREINANSNTNRGG